MNLSINVIVLHVFPHFPITLNFHITLRISYQFPQFPKHRKTLEKLCCNWNECFFLSYVCYRIPWQYISFSWTIDQFHFQSSNLHVIHRFIYIFFFLKIAVPQNIPKFIKVIINFNVFLFGDVFIRLNLFNQLQFYF